jgi:hypothetical protein
VKRVKLASYGTCTECRRVMATTSAGVLRPHTFDRREGPHAVAKEDCPGGARRWQEYDADVAAVQAAQLPATPVQVIDVTVAGGAAGGTS